MLEFLLCSMVTILPDYLYRRFAEGKRLGKEINIYSVWYELRWGITTCVILTVLLVTVIFYYHPSTKVVTSFYRTIPILPESSGRVAEVYVGLREEVKAGQPLFRLDDSQAKAALEAAKRRIAEVDAAMVVARGDLAAADATIAEAQSSLKQAQDEYDTRAALAQRSSNTVSKRDLEKAETLVTGRQASLEAARAKKASIEAQVNSLLPAQKDSAEAALDQAQVELNKTVVRAGVDGYLEQFTLQVGDIVNPFMRPAGTLVPEKAGRLALQAGFNQIEAQIIKPGMVGEITCVSMPFAIVPVVVTQIQKVVAAGQIRPSDQLIDPMQVTQPGTLTVYLEPLYNGSLDKLPPGSSCTAFLYTDNHDLIETGEVGFWYGAFLHMVDTVALVKAGLLRAQALLLPVQSLVLSGH